MDARIYLDYADFRSYLAVVQHPRLVDLVPVSFDLCLLDGQMLSAATGEPSVRLGERGWRYQREDAERWAESLQVPLLWPEKSINSGLALRVSAWVAEQPGQRLDLFCKSLFTEIWGKQRLPTEALLREVLERIGLDAEAGTSFANSSEAYHRLDMRVEAALADGVFEVPCYVVEGERFIGFDRMEHVAQRAAEAWLARAEGELVHKVLAERLLALPPGERRSLWQRLSARPEGSVAPAAVEPETAVRFEPIANAIRTLPVPPSDPHLPVVPPDGLLSLAFFSGTTSPGRSQLELLEDFIAACPANTLVVWGPGALELPALGTLYQQLRSAPVARPRMLMGRASLAGRTHWLSLALLGDEVDIEAQPMVGDGVAPPPLRQHQSWHLQWLGGACPDAIRLRHAALAGAHVLVCSDDSLSSVAARAAALHTRRYFVVVDKVLRIYDGDGAALSLSAGAPPLALGWPPRHPERAGATLWAAPAARTLLIQDEPLRLGAQDSGAELSLAVRGSGLVVATSGGKSLLSSNRRYENIRVHAGTLLLIPLLENHLLSAETVAHKALSTLSRCPREARPLMVNYWPELAFSALELLRPAIAAVAQAWRIPVIVVVGTRPIELWSTDSAGGVFSVEAEGEHFVIDLAQVDTAQQHRQRLLETWGDNWEAALQVLASLGGRMALRDEAEGAEDLG